MVKYDEKLKNYNVASPDKEIVVVGEKYISKEPSTFTINFKTITFPHIEILDNDGKKCFKTDYKTLSRTISDLEDNFLLSMETGFISDKIYSEKKIKEKVAEISSVNNTTKRLKYKIEFTNKINGKKDIINMKCSESYHTIGFFNGKEKEGAPMICRIRRTPEKHHILIVEIAPNVDIPFMIVLAIYSLKCIYWRIGCKFYYYY